MTSSLSLTPNPSTGSLDADCTKRTIVLPSLGVITGTHSGPSPSSSTSTTPTPAPSPTTESACDASVNRIQTRTTNRTIVACPWTGVPIRAIIPLPRRKLGTNGVQDTILSRRSTVVPRPTHFWDDADVDFGADDDDDDEEEEEEDEGSDEDYGGRATLRCCSYESITAAKGLSAWSFEELRAECYAQSLVARGTKPLPVVQPALAIPPAFVPRFVPRS